MREHPDGAQTQAETDDRVHNARDTPHRAASDTSRVTLREITEDTVIDVVRLKVTKDQERFVAPNAVSLAQALFSLGRPARAEGHARRAIRWFEERGMRPYALRSYAILLDILVAQDDQAGAAEARLRVQELNQLIDWPTEEAVLPSGARSDSDGAAAVGSE